MLRNMHGRYSGDIITGSGLHRSQVLAVLLSMGPRSYVEYVSFCYDTSVSLIILCNILHNLFMYDLKYYKLFSSNVLCYSYERLFTLHLKEIVFSNLNTITLLLL